MFYSLFVFRLSYKIIGLSSVNIAGRGLADRGLTRLWPTGVVWAGYGPETCGPGRAGPGLGQTFTVCFGSGPGLGLNSSLRAWAGPGRA